MKNTYSSISYGLFLVPAFIYLILITFSNDLVYTIESMTLLINLIFLVLLLIFICVLILVHKLKIPTEKDRSEIIFGIIGNIVVYFYIFQNQFNISNVVTVYLVVLLVMVLHWVLISHQFNFNELWVLLVIFIIVDFLNIVLTGCGVRETYWVCQPTNNYPITKFIVEISMVVAITIPYVYRILVRIKFNYLRIGNFLLSFIIIIQALLDALLFKNSDMILLITLIFSIAIDVIITFVNHKNKSDLFFTNLRIITLVIVYFIFAESGTLEYYRYTENTSLYSMIVITYVSFGIIIIKSLTGYKDEKFLDLIRMKYYPIDNNEIKKIEEVFNKKITFGNKIGQSIYCDKNLIGYYTYKQVKMDKINQLDVVLFSILGTQKNKKMINGLIVEIEKTAEKLDSQQLSIELEKDIYESNTSSFKNYVIISFEDNIRIIKKI